MSNDNRVEMIVPVSAGELVSRVAEVVGGSEYAKQAPVPANSFYGAGGFSESGRGLATDYNGVASGAGILYGRDSRKSVLAEAPKERIVESARSSLGYVGKSFDLREVA